MAIKVGDKVRFLNSIGEGIVTSIDGKIAHVEDEDGFVTPVLLKECVVVGQAQSTYNEVKSEETKTIPVNDNQVKTYSDEPELEPFEETAEGEKISVVLVFEPHNIKELSNTTWDTFLVNDSNYWMSMAYLWKTDDSDQWTTKHFTMLEPGTQIFIGELTPADLPTLKKIAIQYISFKEDRPFRLKRPILTEIAIDSTNFLKFHTYSPNLYFEDPVYTLEIVKDDRIMHPRRDPSPRNVDEGLKAKKEADLRSLERRRQVRKFSGEQDPMAPLVVDLHIEELVDSVRGMSPADILNRQVDEFRDIMDANAKYRGKKIVFIHGKGEGVLKNALLKELTHRYKGHQVQDASFRDYGFGATQVII